MTSSKSPNRRASAGDPLNDLLDDTGMKRSAARARPQIRYPRAGNPQHVVWVALAASVIWVLAVLAFAWGRFGLPSNPGSAVEAAQSRLVFADWLVILAAIIGPLLLIWVIAWLVRRSMELRDESRKLARAAVLLADAAEIAEKRIAELRPVPGEVDGRVAAEIERTNDAIGALRRQFASMQKTLVRQGASLGTNGGAAAAVVAGGATAASALLASSTESPSRGSVDGAPRRVMDEPELPKVTAAVKSPVADGPRPVSELRKNLRAVSAEAGWHKLVSDEPAAAPEPPKRPPAVADTIPPHTPPSPAVPVPGPARIDPFDDLGPSAPKPSNLSGLGAAGAALGTGAGAATYAGATPAIPPLSTAMDDPAPPVSADASLMPKREDMEIMSRKLDWKKFVRAANFPESENDTETLDALYEVLTDPGAAALLQFSEDVLATLADLDLYMEDFVAEMSPVNVWRGHLDGKDKVNRINAPVEQSRIQTKLSADADFRALAKTFFERFEASMRRLLDDPEAEDRLVVEMADTRTGRAYLLVMGASGKL